MGSWLRLKMRTFKDADLRTFDFVYLSTELRETRLFSAFNMADHYMCFNRSSCI